jgi:hypothetical protein
MCKNILPFLCFIIIFWLLCPSGFSQTGEHPVSGNKQIDVDLDGPNKDNQTLFTGRVWRNTYYRVKGDQFLYSKVFMPGSVSIDGTTFRNVNLIYDIYTDEIITYTSNGSFLRLNKEAVDSFSIIFENTKRNFFRTDVDSIKGYSGFVNIIYSGKSSLYAKYKKEIELLAVENKYDEFYQTQKYFIEKDSVVNPIAGRRDLLLLLGDEKAALKSYIKKNRLFITIEKPETIIQVLRYYDSLH